MIVDATNNIQDKSNVVQKVQYTEIGGGETPPTMLRQSGTAVQRGTQTISGGIIIADVNTGVPKIIIGYFPGKFGK